MNDCNLADSSPPAACSEVGEPRVLPSMFKSLQVSFYGLCRWRVGGGCNADENKVTLILLHRDSDLRGSVTEPEMSCLHMLDLVEFTFLSL